MSVQDYCTPPELVEAFKKLHGGFFVDEKALGERIREESDKFNLRYIARSTGPSRSQQIFCCRYYNSIFNCRAYLKYSYNRSNKIAYFEQCDLKHTHDVKTTLKKKMMNQLSQIEKSRIKALTEAGMTASSIRLLDKLTCSKDVLYSARRKVLVEMKENEMELLFNELKSWNNWEYIIKIDNEKRFNGCYAFNNYIIQKSYSSEICIIDDTSCTNLYGLPILCLITEDENAKSQLISFAILCSREKSEFIDFLTQLKTRIGNIRLFVSDRNKTQITAIKSVFNNCNIIYCSVHISRNLRQKAGNEIVLLYNQLNKKEVTETVFINICEEIIKMNPNSKVSKFLLNLLNERECWLPSIIDHYVHYDNTTTNRVEGFFGSLKNLLDHKQQSLSNIVRAIHIRAERLKINSINESQIMLPEQLMSPNDAKKIGNFPSAFILSEFRNIETEGVIKSDLPDENCCHNQMIYDLPCKHLILKRIEIDAYPLLSIEDIPKRWMHEVNEDLPQRKEISIIPAQKIKEKTWDYSECIDKFEKYFSIAYRSQEVQEILDNTLDTLSSIEHSDVNEEKPILPPKNLLIAGAPYMHPRNNVDRKSGTPRKKKKYKCSLCGSEDHTAPRCPKRDKF